MSAAQENRRCHGNGKSPFMTLVTRETGRAPTKRRYRLFKPQGRVSSVLWKNQNNKNRLGQKINTLKLLLRHHSLLVYLVCWIWEQFLARVRDGVSMWNCKCFNPFISFFKKTQLTQFRSSCCHMLKYRILQNKNYTQKKALMFHNTLVSIFESKRKLVWTLRNKEVTLLVFGKIQLVVYYQCWVLIGWATTGLYVIVP